MSLRTPIGQLARRMLSQESLGRIDYYRFPEQREAWGGPFNGQPGRQALFGGVVAGCRPTVIVETGAFKGTTTEFMAATGLPVFTIEGHPRNFGYCRARFRNTGNVQIYLGDSRVRLRELLDGTLRPRLAETMLFYLDAHWDEDLPLAEEIEIIFSRSGSAISLIDDFAVPGDPGYAYDDYGPGKALNGDYIAPLLARFGLTAYYPSLASADEGGLRRGCVLLAHDALHGAAIRAAGFRV